MPSDLETFVAQAQDGDLNAFNEIVRRFQDMAVGYACALVGDTDLAQDVAQDAFVAAFEKLDQLRDSAAFPGWFRQIVYARCTRYLRRQTRDVPLDSVVEMAAKLETPVEEMESQETKTWILNAVWSLPDSERMAVWLFYMGDCSHQEIATFLDVSQPTVNRWLRAARKQLKKRLLNMAKENLQDMAPSKDDEFVNMVGLRNAIVAGDLQQVRSIVSQKPELVKLDFLYRRPIHLAAMAGQAEMAQFLIEQGADLNQGYYPDRATTTPLILARERGHLNVVKVIEDYFASQKRAVSMQQKGVEAAFQAIRDADHEHLEVLIKEDVRLVNMPDDQGKVLLHLAVHRRDITAIGILIDHGAQIDQPDMKGWHPIHWALNKGLGRMPDYVSAGVLIGRGAKYDMCVACGVGDVAAVKRFLKDDPLSHRSSRPTNEPFTTCGFGKSNDIPLTNAARGGHLNVVKVLLDAGADPNSSDDPPLTGVSAIGHLQIVELLLDAGADPDAPRNIPAERETVQREAGSPLWHAAKYNHLDVAKLLLARGASACEWLYASGDPMERAEENKNLEMIELLHAHGAEYKPSRRAKMAGKTNFEAFQERLAQDPKALEDFRTLRGASRQGELDKVDLILSYKPKYSESDTFDIVKYLLNGPAHNSTQETIDRMRENTPTILKRLLTYGFDPNMRGKVNETPLHWLSTTWSAKNVVRTTFAQILLDFGADIHALDDEKCTTPLGWAARVGNVELVEFFLSKGADPNVSGETWSKPLNLAEHFGHNKVADLLREHGAKN